MDWKQILTELVEFVRSAAPAVWEIYRRQVAVEVVQFAMLAILSGIVFAWLFVAGNRAMKRHKERANSNIDDVDASLFWCCSAGCALVSLILIIVIIGRLANPDYYVIQLMLGTIK